MRDDILVFFQDKPNALLEMKELMAEQVKIAAARSLEIEAWQSGAHAMLLRAIRLLSSHINAMQEVDEPSSRQKIAVLCGYIQASASCLHRLAIPPYQTHAFDAAQDIELTAIQILHDLGNLA